MKRRKNKFSGGKNKILDPVYAGICVSKGHFFVSISNGAKDGKAEKVEFEDRSDQTKKLDEKIFSWLSSYSKKNAKKIVALGLAGHPDPVYLSSELWLKQDIVVLLSKGNGKNGRECAKRVSIETFKRFGWDNIIDIRFNPPRRVIAPMLNDLEDYEKISSKDEFKLLVELAKKYRQLGGRMVFFSATPRGGGVAIMRHAMMRLYRVLGLDISWFVLSANQGVFEITKKKFHNILQGIAPPDIRLREKDKRIIEGWADKNAERFERVFKRSNIIVIDDPQPSGMIPHIKRINPGAKIIFRCHIQLDVDKIGGSKTPQRITWKYLWERIKMADLFISQPNARFVPKDVPPKKLAYMAPSTDKLDGLNKELLDRDMEYYLNMFNNILESNGQDKLDLKRPYIIQVARFDPSKGFPDVLESYRKLREKLEKSGTKKNKIPQLVLCGHGSIDDPEGETIFSELLSMLQFDDFKGIADDVKAARLPHVDQMFNALLRKSKIALQLSHREGFEFKVTEALDKGVPVVAYRAGGIPLQIEHEVTGYLLEIGNTDEVANKMHELLADEKKYKKMSNNAKKKVNSEYFTVNNASEWLYLASELLGKGQIRGDGRYVTNMMKRTDSDGAKKKRILHMDKP